MTIRLFFLTALLLPAAAHAQHGTVHYEFAKKHDFEIPEEVKNMDGIEELIEQFPTHDTRRLVLDFDASASNMYEDKGYTDSLRAAFDPEKMMEEIGPMQMMAFGMAMMESMEEQGIDLLDQQPPTATYVSFDEETYVQERPIMDRIFLVTGDLEGHSWKLSGAERSFLGHRIVRATAMQDTVEVEAWFTPEIPVPAGPALFGGLPGLILVVSINQGHETYTATHLDLETAPSVARPEGGREVTLEKFEQIAEEKAREMEAAISRLRSGSFDF